MRLYVVNTHLHHELDAASAELRSTQSTAICEWMTGWRDCAAHCILLGDFNAPPVEPAYAVYTAHGYTSAYFAVHGCEPERTFPTGVGVGGRGAGGCREGIPCDVTGVRVDGCREHIPSDVTGV